MWIRNLRAVLDARPGRAAGPSFRSWLTAAAAAVALPGTVVAFTVTGAVLDRSGGPLPGVALSVGDAPPAAHTATHGSFSLQLDAGEHTLVARHPAHRTVHRTVVVEGDRSGLEIVMPPALAASESITVTAVRADDRLPVTTTNLDREEIDELSYGQDPPALLESTPSATWTSDSGIGSNYSYLSLRGIHHNRLNFTLDGAPLNDPAEHALYFNNFHGLLSMVDSVQVQRGVGTSTVGSPSYGGSVNFASLPFTAEREVDATMVLGSYDTTRASVGFQTGVLDSGFAVAARVATASTDGYRDHSGTDHRTVFLNAAWQGSRTQLKLVSFSGREETELSYLAVDADTLRSDPTYNPMAEEETDRFDQSFAQLQLTHLLGDDTVLSASVYANAADGWFRLWDDPVARGQLLEFGIDQHFLGSMVSLSHTAGRLETTVGVHYNDFEGDHTLHAGSERLYLNTGYKEQASAFVKTAWERGPWVLFGDLQLRWAEFSYRGRVDLGPVSWDFVDPKVGARYRLSPHTSVYASVGRAQREPARLDLLAGEDDATVRHDLEAVRPERVLDVEAGLSVATRRLALEANLYAMEFTDEIALTGELSDIGLPLRRNVDSSFRRGLELDLRWVLGRHWSLTHASSFSHNRIEAWTQFYDVYDAEGRWIGSEPLVHRDVEPLLTPEIIVNQGVELTTGAVEAALTGRWVSSSHLDNTDDDRFRTPSYLSVDLRGSLHLHRWPSLGRPTLTVHVNNLLDDEEIWPSGYSYLFLEQDPDGRRRVSGIPYYYPRAGRHVMVSLELGF